MPGFRGIRMVSFDKDQQKVVVRSPQAVEAAACVVWPEPAISILVDIMAIFYRHITNEPNQREEYYQKAFAALAFHLMQLEKEKVIPPDFLGNMTKEKMQMKWQEIEHKYSNVASSLTPGGPTGQQIWPYFDKVTFIFQTSRIVPPETTRHSVSEGALEEPNTTNPQNSITGHIPPTSASMPSSPAPVTACSPENGTISRSTATSETDQAQLSPHQESPKELSEQEFRKEMLCLMRRRVELLEEQKAREDKKHEERREIMDRLVNVLEKLAEKL
ncbi:hypothetical protein RMATCC62417_09292 [Rhizopus microsporus]|nr:hypothetical protein RMATCC62417_09292 [Rhizopus microsporus]CEI89457.1 hypothetical protein RMCBS344292_03812 [Rhizopus microsporus]